MIALPSYQSRYEFDLKEGKMSATFYLLALIPWVFTFSCEWEMCRNLHRSGHHNLGDWLYVLFCVIIVVVGLIIFYKAGASIWTCANPSGNPRRDWNPPFLPIKICLLHHPGLYLVGKPDPAPTPSPTTAALFLALSCAVVVLWASVGWMPSATVLGLGSTSLWIIFGIAAFISLLFASSTFDFDFGL
jgi:hypothetical protein